MEALIVQTGVVEAVVDVAVTVEPIVILGLLHLILITNTRERERVCVCERERCIHVLAHTHMYGCESECVRVRVCGCVSEMQTGT